MKALGIKGIENFRDVLENGYKKIDGHTVDSFTASAVVGVYDKLSAANQEKFIAMPILKVVDITWKLLK